MKILLTTLFTPLTILCFTGSILLIATASYAQTYTADESAFPLSLVTLEKIQEGKIDYEVKSGQIFVSVIDRYRDSHIHLLSHDGISQEEALKILSSKKAMLENQGSYTVERVIDGDTLKLTNGEEVQLIGIKAPEDETMGQEATEFVKRFVKEGQEVRLKLDVQDKDKYGRLLAYVFLDEDKPAGWHLLAKYSKGMHYVEHGGEDQLFLNATIIGMGYATPMTVSPNVKHADLFKKLYEEERKQKRGLWK